MHRLFVIPSSAPHPRILSFYERSYQLWQEIWFETLKGLDDIERLHSDGFTRQDFFVVAMSEEKPIALCCFKEMDLTLACHRDDSWFLPWPKDLLLELSTFRKHALVPSWLTVHPQFRKSAGAVSNWGLIMSEIISLVCLDVKAEIAFGTPRKDRSVDKLVAQAGAQRLKENVLHHGVLIDLVAFYPEVLSATVFSKETLELWSNKIDLRLETKKLSAGMPQEFIEKEKKDESPISRRDGKFDRDDGPPAMGE